MVATSLSPAFARSGSARSGRQAATATRAAAELRAENGSHADGDARLSWRRRHHILVVRVRLRRLAARSRHPMRIETGSCHDFGALVYPLRDVVANEFGGGRATTHIGGVTTTNFDSAWHVTVYKGPTMDGGGSQPIACGQVRPVR